MENEKEDFIYLFKLYERDATSVAKTLGIARSKYYYWLKHDLDFKKIIEYIKVNKIDLNDELNEHD
jgi:hypothetical protein